MVIWKRMIYNGKSNPSMDDQGYPHTIFKSYGFPMDFWSDFLRWSSQSRRTMPCWTFARAAGRSPVLSLFWKRWPPEAGRNGRGGYWGFLKFHWFQQKPLVDMENDGFNYHSCFKLRIVVRFVSLHSGKLSTGQLSQRWMMMDEFYHHLKEVKGP